MEWEYLFLYLWPYRERPRDFFFQSLCPVGSLSKDLGLCSPHGLDAQIASW